MNKFNPATSTKVLIVRTCKLRTSRHR